MKNILFIFLLFVAQGIVAQRGDGIYKIEVEVGGSKTTLYNESHALIIGISAYNNGWPKLPGVKADVGAVKNALEQSGFNVVVHNNLSKQQMDNAFTDFIGKYGQKPDNRLLFYFAGHGHTIATSYGDTIGYIVPVDAPNPNFNQSGFQSRAMPMSRVEEYAKLTQSKHALFLFDACFSGSLFALDRSLPEAISYKTTNPVRQFITSGSKDETVPDKSIFRQQFVTALTTDYADATGDGYLTGTELGIFLQDKVINYSRGAQHPQYGKIRNQFLDKGDFVFVIKKPETNGTLQITSAFQGELFIDGKSYGYVLKNIPVSHQIQAGKHAVIIKSLETESMNQIWQQSITIKQSETLPMKPTIAVAKKEENTSRGNTENSNSKGNDLPDIVTDIDGNTYKIVEIGTQVWMAENLRTTKYNDGTTIPNVTDNDKWTKLTTPAYCWYKNDISNKNKYGALYNWYTVETEKLCPIGWHVPSDEEWKQLEMHLGMTKTDADNTGWRGDPIGKKLKSTSGWNKNGNGNNESGSTALPGGYRDAYNGSFGGAGKDGYWWSSTPNGSEFAYYRGLYYDYGKVYRDWYYRKYGFSVRCVKD